MAVNLSVDQQWQWCVSGFVSGFDSGSGFGIKFVSDSGVRTGVVSRFVSDSLFVRNFLVVDFVADLTEVQKIWR